MTYRHDQVPPLYYLLAVVAGLVGLPLMFMLARLFAGVSRPEALGDAWGAAGAGFAVGYAVLGALFGLLWPQPTWRWGFWLTALPLLFASILGPGLWVFAGWAAQTMLPACSAAYAAARLHFKYTEVDESG